MHHLKNFKLFSPSKVCFHYQKSRKACTRPVVSKGALPISSPAMFVLSLTIVQFTGEVFFQTYINLFFGPLILQIYFLILKINAFWGDVSDILAVSATLQFAWMEHREWSHWGRNVRLTSPALVIWKLEHADTQNCLWLSLVALSVPGDVDLTALCPQVFERLACIRDVTCPSFV